MVRTEVSVAELCDHCVRKIEIAVNLRNRERAFAAIKYLAKEVDRVYFRKEPIDGKTPLASLLGSAPRQIAELEKLGILTVADIRKTRRDDLLAQLGLGPCSVANICEKLADHGVYLLGEAKD